MDEYIVICKDEEQPVYRIATRQVYRDLKEAHAYWQTIALSREPRIVTGDFRHLRFRNHQ